MRRRVESCIGLAFPYTWSGRSGFLCFGLNKVRRMDWSSLKVKKNLELLFLGLD